jgi:geranylgeranyl pyrophosphate synthase
MMYQYQAENPIQPAMISLEAFFSCYLSSLKEELQDIVQRLEPLPADFIGILRHYLDENSTAFTPYQTWTGRYVQPLLCLLACEACSGDWQQALPAAAAIELMQTSFLVHDEVRGKSDPHHKSFTRTPCRYAREVNAGDTLFSMSNLALGRLYERGVPATIVVNALYLLNCAGLALATSQYLHLGLEGRDNIAIEDYLVMAEGKTALAVCACEVGALIASAADVQREGLHSFGRHLGMVHYMCSSIRRGCGGGFLRPNKRDFIEQLAQEQREQAIAALKKGNLKGPAVQALYELAQMPFSSESLFRLVYDVETIPCL